MGCGKDGSHIYFNPTTCWCHLDAQFPSSVGPHGVEVLRYLSNKLRLTAPFYDGYDII